MHSDPIAAVKSSMVAGFGVSNEITQVPQFQLLRHPKTHMLRLNTTHIQCDVLCCAGVVAKVLDSNSRVSKFELESRYYIFSV